MTISLHVCHLATCQINFQLELLSIIDKQDIEIASIFHLVESTLAKRAFWYRGVTIWNNLSKDLREIINAKVFKRRLIDELICNMNLIRC